MERTAILTGLLALMCYHITSAQQIDFAADIQPILANKCYSCHGPDQATRQGQLRLDTRRGVFAKRDQGGVTVLPGKPAESLLWQRISNPGSERMPPPDSGKTLSTAERVLFRRWIEAGAPWKQHWAFIPPQRPRLPIAAARSKARTAIDHLVQERWRHEKLPTPAAAPKTTLLRRVTLDLLGIPATLAENDAFLQDESPDAFERVVDGLLASPHYGERMAIPWLDAARYADTHGYLFDTERSMWRWRDWVIQAFNQNQPFDQFTIEQIAGDLLPNATQSQLTASGFNRNHLINNEAGAIPAEYLVENVIDRVNTTATVWMGLTLACCQCHDHKYDPFTQQEYYQLYAFFNTVPELGLDGLNSNAKPHMKAPTARDRAELRALEQRTAAAKKQIDNLANEIAAGQAAWEQTYIKTNPDPTKGLAAYWKLDKELQDATKSAQQIVFEASPSSYAEGILGAAASLNGLSYLNAGDRFNWTAKDAFSLTAWVRLKTQAGRQSIFARMENAKQLFRGYTLQTFVGVPSFFLLHRFPDNMIQVQGKTALEPERWYHLAVTYDGSGKAEGVKLYLNGDPQKPAVVVDRLTGPVETPRSFWVGNGHPEAKLKGLIDEVRVYRRPLSTDEIKRLPGLSIQSLIAIQPKHRNREQTRRVRDFYLTQHAPPAWRQLYESLTELQEAVERRERTVPTVMVMREQETPRETTVLLRGAYDRPGKKVSAGTPAVLPPFGQERPRNRLGLARWLVSGDHPLTARTTVNRYWQMYFGTGLVQTSEDFGVQGDRPSHPDLLDWLATEFVRSGWDVKAMQRLIVTSTTYRQSSYTQPEIRQRDPDNRLLTRGPRARLSAELIRDQALFASGLLVRDIGGPSVKPYQPDGLWREVAFDFSGASLTAQVYSVDTGANLYRRSLYTFWKRTAPPPALLLFDAPVRERCVVRRMETSTPLQALVLMNDPTYVEAARRFAERLMRDGNANAKERIQKGFRRITARKATDRELSPLVSLFERRRAVFAADEQLAEQLIGVGESAPDPAFDRATLAAYTVVANVLLNLDETITKP